MSPRWDLVYKWSDPETRSIVDAVTSALDNCDRKLTEALAAASPSVTEPETPGAPRTEAGKRLHNDLAAMMTGTPDDSRNQWVRLIRRAILAIEAEAAAPPDAGRRSRMTPRTDNRSENEAAAGLWRTE